MISLQTIEQRIPAAERVAFISKAKSISTRLGIPYFAIMAVMDFETDHTMRADIVNDFGYVGLIQFGSQAAKDLGTTLSALQKMTRIEQLDYVESYFKLWMKRLGLVKLRDFLDLYLIIFFPAGVKETDYNKDFTYAAVEKANPSLANKNGHITKNNIKNNYSKIYGSGIFTEDVKIIVSAGIGFFLAYFLG